MYGSTLFLSKNLRGSKIFYSKTLYTVDFIFIMHFLVYRKEPDNED